MKVHLHPVSGVGLPCLAFSVAGGKSSVIVTHPVVVSVRNQKVQRIAFTVRTKLLSPVIRRPTSAVYPSTAGPKSPGFRGNTHSPIPRFSSSSVTHHPSDSTPGAVSEIGLRSIHSDSAVQDPKDDVHILQLLSDVACRLPHRPGNVLSFPESAPSMRGSLSKTRFFGQSHWWTTLDEMTPLQAPSCCELCD